MADQPVVGIIMGSKSDLATMEGCTAELERLGVPYELVIASAHRTPDKVHQWAETAADRGLKVIIAAAGKAAHLGGVVASLLMAQKTQLFTQLRFWAHLFQSIARRSFSLKLRWLTHKLTHKRRWLYNQSHLRDCIKVTHKNPRFRQESAL